MSKRSKKRWKNKRRFFNSYNWDIKKEEWWGDEYAVEIKKKAYLKMCYYCQAADGEISGLGRVRKDDITKKLIIEDLTIFEQECSGGGTTLDDKMLHKFTYELAKNGENPGKWRLWWHTHNDFGVFWSAVDTDNIGRHSEDSWLLSTCINKKLHMIARVDESGKEAEIEINIEQKEDIKLKEKCQREVKRLVKQATYSQSRGFHGKVVSRYKSNERFEDYLTNSGVNFTRDRQGVLTILAGANPGIKTKQGVCACAYPVEGKYTNPGYCVLCDKKMRETTNTKRSKL